MRIKMMLPFLFAAAIAPAIAQVKDYKPVTEEMLKNPSPDDWLMYSRTYDAQRYSPLKQIDKQNVATLGLAWTKALSAGSMEGIPLVHNGVMYVIAPAGVIEALNAATGDVIWEYKHQMQGGGNATSARSKTIAIYQDVILYCAPDSTIVGIDAATGKLRWSVPDPRGHTSGAIVVQGKVITGGACSGGLRATCYIAANDALTGKEIWKFYTAQGTNDVNPDTWGGAPEEKRTTSTWGLPGTYDPVQEPGLLGHRQSHTEHAPGASRRQYRRDSAHLSVRSVQQFDGGSRSGYRQARLVLSAPARRRLG